MKKIISKIKIKSHKDIWFNSMTGMTIGFISTLVVGTLFSFIGSYSDDNLFVQIKKALMFVCPFAIGVGIGVKHKIKPLAIMAVAFSTFIVAKSLLVPHYDSITGFNFTNVKFEMDMRVFMIGDVFAAWLAGVAMLYFFEIYKFETKLDLFIIPGIGIIFGVVNMTWMTYITTLLAILIEFVVNHTINDQLWKGILLAPIFGLAIGWALTLPTSSAAMVFALKLHGDAAIVAMSATAAQMISFGVMTYITTKDLPKALATGVGSPMIQMNNYFQRPRILIIPGIASMVAAVVGLAGFHGLIDYSTTSVATGMGASAFCGQILSLQMNGWGNQYMWMNIIFVQFLLAAVVAAPLSMYAVKKEWLKKPYLMVKN